MENFIGEYVQADFFLQLERGTISPEKFYTIIREKVKKNIDDENMECSINIWNSMSGLDGIISGFYTGRINGN